MGQFCGSVDRMIAFEVPNVIRTFSNLPILFWRLNFCEARSTVGLWQTAQQR